MHSNSTSPGRRPAAQADLVVDFDVAPCEGDAQRAARRATGGLHPNEAVERRAAIVAERGAGLLALLKLALFGERQPRKVCDAPHLILMNAAGFPFEAIKRTRRPGMFKLPAQSFFFQSQPPIRRDGFHFFIPAFSVRLTHET